MSQSGQQYDRLGDRARLHRQADVRPILMVEGPSDRRFIHRVLGEGLIQVLMGGTRTVVLQGAHDAHHQGLNRCVGVVDRDFDGDVDVAEADGVPLAAYDGADLEHMLLLTPSFDRMMYELGSEGKILAFGGVDAVRQHALAMAMPLASLRAANAVNSWGINFDELDIAARIDRQSLELNETGLIDAVFTAAGGNVTRDELQRCVRNDPPVCPTTGYPLVRGRDTLAVVGVSLRRATGSISKVESNQDRLANILRLSGDATSLRDTSWLQRVQRLIA